MKTISTDPDPGGGVAPRLNQSSFPITFLTVGPFGERTVQKISTASKPITADLLKDFSGRITDTMHELNRMNELQDPMPYLLERVISHARSLNLYELSHLFLLEQDSFRNCPAVYSVMNSYLGSARELFETVSTVPDYDPANLQMDRIGMDKLADEIDRIQQDIIQERMPHLKEISVIATMISFLRAGKLSEAVAVTLNESDKLERYPEICNRVQRVWGRGPRFLKALNSEDN